MKRTNFESNGAEDLAVGLADLLPVVDVDDVDACSHDVLQSSSRALERR